MTIDARRTGATIISRRKPNSRSHTSEARGEHRGEQHRHAEDAGEDERLAGRRRRWPARTATAGPSPSTNRNSSGWTSDVTIRMRSLAKRISSRRQTTLTARSLRRASERSGTRTRDDVRRRWRSSPRPRHRAHHRAVAIAPRRRSRRRGSSCPCSDMKTSSSVGRETLTDVIGDAELGEQPRHELLARRRRGTSPRPRRPRPRCRSARAARRSPPRRRRCSIRTRSAPTLAFSASGVSRTTISPRSMIAMRSQNSASSM